jgi:hypothetical protein
MMCTTSCGRHGTQRAAMLTCASIPKPLASPTTIATGIKSSNLQMIALLKILIPCQSPPCRFPPSHPAKTRDSCCAARERKEKAIFLPRHKNTGYTGVAVAAVICGVAGSCTALFFDRCCVTAYKQDGESCVAPGWVGAFVE